MSAKDAQDAKKSSGTCQRGNGHAQPATEDASGFFTSLASFADKNTYRECATVGCANKRTGSRDLDSHPPTPTTHTNTAMSWPWSTIGLPDDATPAAIRAAFDAWKKKLDAGEVTGSARDTFEIERAFETAIELA